MNDCGYLPVYGESLPFGRDQMTLLGDVGICVNNLPSVIVHRHIEYH